MLLKGNGKGCLLRRSALWLSVLTASLLLASFLYKSLTYHEETIYLFSSWGHSWNESFVRQVLSMEDDPWVQVDYQIHGGQRTSSGAYIVDRDTLILVLSGPRKEVLRTARSISGRF